MKIVDFGNFVLYRVSIYFLTSQPIPLDAWVFPYILTTHKPPNPLPPNTHKHSLFRLLYAYIIYMQLYLVEVWPESFTFAEYFVVDLVFTRLPGRHHSRYICARSAV